MKKSKKLAHALVDLIYATTPNSKKDHSGGEGLLIQTVIVVGNKSLAIQRNTDLEIYDHETGNHRHFKFTQIQEALKELNNPEPITYDPISTYASHATEPAHEKQDPNWSDKIWKNPLN